MPPNLEVIMKKIQQGDYHLGKMILDFFAERPPNDVCQIDAATGESETNSSVLSRSIRLARRLRSEGYKPGDVLMLGGKNHLDLHIPFYAAHFNGMPVVGVDPMYKYDEIKLLFKITKAKIAFCQHEMYDDYSRAVKDLGLDVKIVTFDGGECSFKKYLEEYEDKERRERKRRKGGDGCWRFYHKFGRGHKNKVEVEDKEPIEEFKAADFDVDKTYAWLVSTSGTSGVPKVAAFTHRPVIDILFFFMKMISARGGETLPINLNLSPVQWISAYLNALGMIIGQVVLQTSRPDDLDHVIDIINKYKPAITVVSPALFASILQSDKPCDLTCFKIITLSGSKIYKQLITNIKARMSPEGVLLELYGMTESLGAVLQPNPMGPVGSCGVPMPLIEVKLVDPETGKEITEPNVTGEIWAKGPMFACYYNNPEETAEAITADGWYRTGDLLYRDADNNYFYVDRLSMLIKYRGNHVDPPEVEEVISSHPDVVDVAVTSIPHDEDCERTVACVVLRTGSSLTAQDIKNLVADKLSVGKQLHGGVIFMKELPKTSTGKTARANLKKLVLNLDRE